MHVTLCNIDIGFLTSPNGRKLLWVGTMHGSACSCVVIDGAGLVSSKGKTQCYGSRIDKTMQPTTYKTWWILIVFLTLVCYMFRPSGPCSEIPF
jgi:hypothetical protein